MKIRQLGKLAAFWGLWFGLLAVCLASWQTDLAGRAPQWIPAYLIPWAPVARWVSTSALAAMMAGLLLHGAEDPGRRGGSR